MSVEESGNVRAFSPPNSTEELAENYGDDASLESKGSKATLAGTESGTAAAAETPNSTHSTVGVDGAQSVNPQEAANPLLCFSLTSPVIANSGSGTFARNMRESGSRDSMTVTEDYGDNPTLAELVGAGEAAMLDVDSVESTSMDPSSVTGAPLRPIDIRLRRRRKTTAKQTSRMSPFQSSRNVMLGDRAKSSSNNNIHINNSDSDGGSSPGAGRRGAISPKPPPPPRAEKEKPPKLSMARAVALVIVLLLFLNSLAILVPAWLLSDATLEGSLERHFSTLSRFASREVSATMESVKNEAYANAKVVEAFQQRKNVNSSESYAASWQTQATSWSFLLCSALQQQTSHGSATKLVERIHLAMQDGTHVCCEKLADGDDDSSKDSFVGTYSNDSSSGGGAPNTLLTTFSTVAAVNSSTVSSNTIALQSVSSTTQRHTHVWQRWYHVAAAHFATSTKTTSSGSTGVWSDIRTGEPRAHDQGDQVPTIMSYSLPVFFPLLEPSTSTMQQSSTLYGLLSVDLTSEVMGKVLAAALDKDAALLLLFNPQPPTMTSNNASTNALGRGRVFAATGAIQGSAAEATLTETDAGSSFLTLEGVSSHHDDLHHARGAGNCYQDLSGTVTNSTSFTFQLVGNCHISYLRDPLWASGGGDFNLRLLVVSGHVSGAVPLIKSKIIIITLAIVLIVFPVLGLLATNMIVSQPLRKLNERVKRISSFDSPTEPLSPGGTAAGGGDGDLGVTEDDEVKSSKFSEIWCLQQSIAASTSLLADIKAFIPGAALTRIRSANSLTARTVSFSNSLGAGGAAVVQSMEIENESDLESIDSETSDTDYELTIRAAIEAPSVMAVKSHDPLSPRSPPSTLQATGGASASGTAVVSIASGTPPSTGHIVGFRHLTSTNPTGAGLSGFAPIGGGFKNLGRASVSMMVINIQNFNMITLKPLERDVALVHSKIVEMVVRSVTAHRGYVDYFYGDHFVCSFNAMTQLISHKKQAVLCALNLKVLVQQLDKELNAGGSLLLDTAAGTYVGGTLRGCERAGGGRPCISPTHRSPTLVTPIVGFHPMESQPPIVNQMAGSASTGSGTGSGTGTPKLASVPAPKLALSCGIASGKAVVGNMGTESMTRFCCIGDVVSHAFQLERACNTASKALQQVHTDVPVDMSPGAFYPDADSKHNQLNIFTLDSIIPEICSDVYYQCVEMITLMPQTKRQQVNRDQLAMNQSAVLGGSGGAGGGGPVLSPVGIHSSPSQPESLNTAMSFNLRSLASTRPTGGVVSTSSGTQSAAAQSSVSLFAGTQNSRNMASVNSLGQLLPPPTGTRTKMRDSIIIAPMDVIVIPDQQQGGAPNSGNEEWMYKLAQREALDPYQHLNKAFVEGLFGSTSLALQVLEKQPDFADMYSGRQLRQYIKFRQERKRGMDY